jgi:hypothetical protein
VLCFTIRDNGEGKGQIVALDKANGSFLWQHTFEGDYVYTPVIANGVVYVIPAGERDIYGFDLWGGEQLFYESVYYRSQPIIVDHKLFALDNIAGNLYFCGLLKSPASHLDSFRLPPVALADTRGSALAKTHVLHLIPGGLPDRMELLYRIQATNSLTSPNSILRRWVLE